MRLYTELYTKLHRLVRLLFGAKYVSGSVDDGSASDTVGESTLPANDRKTLMRIVSSYLS